jgi:hypothetical protein
MKKLIIAILLIPSLLSAAPFLVCDPQTGVTTYKLTGPAWTPASVPAQPDGSIKMDVSAATVGSSALTVAACITDAVWGELCSTTVPFPLTRPTPPVITKNIRLIP